MDQSTVMAWDTALRASDRESARSLLTDDASYRAPDPPIDCANPDEIIDLMRSLKEVNPDVELLASLEDFPTRVSALASMS